MKLIRSFFCDFSPFKKKDFSYKYLCFCIWLLFGIDNINSNTIQNPTMRTPIQPTNP